jgi:2-amino-4-hydroxy-6-hydroxymethyldihydropteridine diphosphokinase
MNLDTWFSWYDIILKEFGFKRADDEKSAELLNSLLNEDNSSSIAETNIKDSVIIFGAGPSLKGNIEELDEMDRIEELNLNKFTLIAADGATTALLEKDIIPDIIVTDLDGKMDDIIEANNHGAILVIHAHGNNIDKIREYVPKLRRILGTTQSIPLENVYNFGGFTDGDRCIFLAIELGARFILLAGMDFGDIVTKYSRPDLPELEGKADKIKQMKLNFAKKLTQWAAENENVKIVNMSGGESVDGVDDIKFE